MKAQLAAILLVLPIAACGERVPADQTGQGSTTPRYERAEVQGNLLTETVTPVRIGEQGPAFAACVGRGRVRERTVGEPVAVRTAPFEQAQQIDALAADAEFFHCSRSIDQRWFGIVYDEGGRATERCGVSSPIPARRDYQGPCMAGWVSSAQIRLVSGVAQSPPAEPPAAK